MTLAKSAGLAAGFLGAFGLGIALGPTFVDRDGDAPAAAFEERAVSPAVPPEASEPPAPRVKRSARAPRVAASGGGANAGAAGAAIVPPANHPDIQARLKRVLNRGADMQKAAAGFRNAEDFAVVAHAARDTRVPFMLLKHRILEQRMSLHDAIKASQPDADTKAIVAKAKSSARADVQAL